MARFKLQQKVPVVNFLIQAEPPVTTLMPTPWTLPILGVQIEILTITVWEKVPNYWATNYRATDVQRDCDGFHAVDATGQVWWNQYPRASYSQTSDVADWRFTRHFDPKGPRTFEELDAKGLLETYEEAGRALCNLQSRIRSFQSRREPNLERANQLTEVHAVLVKALTEKGCTVKEEHETFLPGYTHFVVSVND